jgi:beta-lactamase class A
MKPIKQPQPSSRYSSTYVLILLGGMLLGGLTVWILNSNVKPSSLGQSDPIVPPSTEDCSKTIVRQSGFSLIKPILYAERACESEALAGIKATVSNFIESQKTAGHISDASLYLRLLDDQTWTSVNGNEEYYPGSLMKIPLMIALLRDNESKPGRLENTTALFDPRQYTNIPQTFDEPLLQPGQTYTLNQLLGHMIEHSDNFATQMLNRYVQTADISRTFSDLGLTPPLASAAYFNYKITPRQFSRFMYTIYNGTCMSNKNSEYAAELLCHSDFKEGIVKQLPSTVKVAHKFGEAGNGQRKELHETAIVYLEGKPYVITIMTRGRDVKTQAAVISQISRLVYDSLNAPPV